MGGVGTLLRARLQKRLLRAGKFASLVQTFGECILGCVPAICVSRLDLVSLNHLQAMYNGSIDHDLVLNIKERLEAVRAAGRAT